MWSAILHVHFHCICISIFVSILILQSMSILCIYIHVCIYMGIMECGVSPHSMLDPYSVSISMSVSICVLWNVECSYTPCTLSFHIHIYICIHIDITECVYTVYLYPCLYLYGYYRVWSVSTLHVRPILCIHIHVCIDMCIMECGV